MPLTDAELLHAYVARGSESAFAALVERHLSLVFSTALRSLNGDSQLAEDVTQQVFARLAQHSIPLCQHPALTGWLYTTSRNTAAQPIRSEVRRKRREQEAEAMNETSPPDSDQSTVDWQKLNPIVDDALSHLRAPDRELILLRYFQGTPYADLGKLAGLGENGARMRVERALARLRTVLAKRGYESSPALLAAALASQSAVAAPPALASSAASGALLSSSGSGPLTKAIFLMLNATKTTLTATAFAALAGIIGFSLASLACSDFRAASATEACAARIKRLTSAAAAQSTQPFAATPSGSPRPMASSATADPRFDQKAELAKFLDLFPELKSRQAEC